MKMQYWILRLAVVLALAAPAQGLAATQDSIRSSPPDTTPYARPAVPEDYAPGGRVAIPTGIFIVDVVVNNTDPNLTNTDTFNDGETSIAVNPLNADEIVITSFAGTWGAAGAPAPLWRSTDGGQAWTKEFSIAVPPMVPGTALCPCDQTVDFGRAGRLWGTFLSFDPATSATDVYSGGTTNPASAAAWSWEVDAFGAAVKTNKAGVGDADQPWLLVNRDPMVARQDNVYVAYDNFSNPAAGVPTRVAAAHVKPPFNPPPVVTIDNQTGTSVGSVNPGHRLAVDPRNGSVYSLFQRNIGVGAGGSKNIDYMLNRSTDGGQTWSLNGSATGIVVANADSTQPTPKFGTVNALLGGVLHAAVDPNTGDLY